MAANMRLALRLMGGVAAAAVLLPHSVSAEPKNPQSRNASTTPELTTGVSISEEYSDNIYASRTDKAFDWITVVNPFANLRFQGANGAANVGGNAALGREVAGDSVGRRV